MFDRILDFIELNPLIKKQVTRKTRTLIHFKNGSRIIALPCGPEGRTLRGHTCDMIILDEANFVPDQVLASVIIPMIATTDGYLIMLSTPWTRDSYFYRAFTNPAYSSYHFPSSVNPQIKPEFLEEQRAMMSDLEFRREYQAEFLDETNCFFPIPLIRSCCEDYAWWSDIPPDKVSGEFYAGLDLGKQQDYSALTVLKREEKRLRLVFMREFALGTPYHHVIGYAKALNEAMPLTRFAVDRTGVGEAVVEELKQNVSAPVEGVTLTAPTKTDVLNGLRMLFEKKEIILPFATRDPKSLERRLITQINEQQYQLSKSGQMTFTHPANSHDDMLWALALAAYASRRGGGFTFIPIPR